MKEIAIILEMKDKLINLGEIDFLEWLQKVYKVNLGLDSEIDVPDYGDRV